MTWNELNVVIENNSSFLISSHLSLDGDCVGSQLALYWYLKDRGKQACIYCVDPLPAKFSFLKNSEMLAGEKPSQQFDVLFILDCSNQSRLGWEGSNEAAKQIVNIDHHRDNTRFGFQNYIDTATAATGEIIYRFFTENNIDFPDHVAESLYCAIMSDTGGFRFSNTTGKILSVCADLANRGADCSAIYENVYASHSQTGLLLQARMWSTLTFHLEGKVCSMELPLSVIDELGAHHSDSEGMADNTVTAKSVEVGIICKHSPTQTHFSLRSKGLVDVGRVAQGIPGGGGHCCAAGCTIDQPYALAMPKMLSIIDKELRG